MDDMMVVFNRQVTSGQYPTFTVFQKVKLSHTYGVRSEAGGGNKNFSSTVSGKHQISDKKYEIYKIFFQIQNFRNPQNV